MGFGSIFKKSSKVDYDKAFEQSPAKVFEGDPSGQYSEAPPAYAKQTIQTMARESNLNPLFYQRCGVLQHYDVILLLDDSGSMNLKTDTKDEFGNLQSRWGELQEFAKNIVSIATAFDRDGIDVYFLNRPPIKGVTSASQLSPAFAKAPQGGTPLPERTLEVLNAYRQRPNRKKLLLLIATDGEPSGYGGKAAFKNVLSQRDFDNEKITILACSSNDEEVGYLNEFDRNIPALDVVDDYRSEKKEIRRVQGMFFSFNRTDFSFKCLLGSIDKWTDQLDEKKLSKRQLEYAQYGDC